jgi:conjugative transfer signal peptidase TraF
MVVEQDKEQYYTFCIIRHHHLFSGTFRIMKYYSGLPFMFADNGLVSPSWNQVRQPLLALISSVLIVGPLLLLMRHFRVLLTLTDSSCAEGFYRLVDAPIRRGELVAACLPVSAEREGVARGYLMRGDCPGGAEPVVKVVDGMVGDQIEVEVGAVVVNGKPLPNSATVARDSVGRPLAHVSWGKRLVAVDEVWLLGLNNRRSWDSRYFGPVSLSAVRGVVEPVLTW